ncbi:MAG: hypothetical protein P4L53_18175 [Candidatus Obscuribacterales bacterium]|nr:hypothetical protein [Candidatus Obscuribacterales bacterium]
MNNAIAVGGGTIVLLVADYDKKIPGCLGYCWERQNLVTGEKVTLTSLVPFSGATNLDNTEKPTDVWPVQKPIWFDEEAPTDTKIQYTVTPIVGTPQLPIRRNDLAVKTNILVLTEELTMSVSFCANNGILATQKVSRAIIKRDGTFDFDKLMSEIKTPNTPLRRLLAGNMSPFLQFLIKKAAAENGHVYLALYELNDPELLQCILDNAKFVSIILSNTGPDDATNKDARAALHAAGIDITDRILASDEIGHNKFVVYVDASGVARFFQGGSINWTFTGLCTQTNGAIRVRSDELSAQALDYWHLLRADSSATPVQSAAFRAANAINKPTITLADGSQVKFWFAPNMQARSKPKTNPPMPPDMAEVIPMVRAAEEAVFALFFNPGHPSVLDVILEEAAARPELVARAAVSTMQAFTKEQIILLHRAGENPVAVPASAIHQAFANYLAETLQAPDTHAVIHNKDLVIDPLHPDLSKVKVVKTCHNMGYKASYQNDENMPIFTGSRSLALAMMANIFYITSEFRFNWACNQTGANQQILGFLEVTDSWQDKYYVAGSTPRREIDYLMRAGTYLSEQTSVVTHKYPLKAESLVALQPQPKRKAPTKSKAPAKPKAPAKTKAKTKPKARTTKKR